METVKLMVPCVPCREEGDPILLPSVKSQKIPSTVNEPIPATYVEIPILISVFNDTNWEIVPKQIQKNVGLPSMLENEMYVETDNAVLAKAKSGDLIRLTNAPLRIIGVKKIWEDDDTYVTYLCCEVQCKAWHGDTRTIKVKMTEYKDIYQEIQRQFPEVCASQGQVLKEYLADVFANRSMNLPVSHEAKMSGWICWDNDVQYVIGNDRFYKKHVIPKLSDTPYAIFDKGRRFLDIGNSNPQICTLFLASHLAYTLFWLNKAGIKFQSTFFVQGGTGLLKTSVVRVIADVFNVDRDKAIIRLNSTLASTQKTITYLRDTVVCVDDFSNTELGTRKKSLSAAEAVIRAVGDGVFPSKSDVSDYRKITHNTVRSVVILTGEEGLDLGTSSQLRLIVIPVSQGTFDGQVLTAFQTKNIWAEYIALYLKFLEENGKKLTAYSQRMFYTYRDGYGKLFEAPRLVDGAAVLRLECDFVVAYARWCGCNDDEAQEMLSLLTQNVFNIMRITQNYTSETKPEVRFIQALWFSLDTTSNTMVAVSEDVFITDETAFIGFYEGDEAIWLKPEEAYQQVCRYYKAINESWLIGFKRVKVLLLEKGISRGKKGINGQGAEYLCRAKKGTRKRMLVLKVSEVKKILNIK